MLRCAECGVAEIEDRYSSIGWRQVRYVSVLAQDQQDTVSREFCCWLCIERWSGKKAAQEERN